jgi:hypothetical protein
MSDFLSGRIKIVIMLGLLCSVFFSAAVCRSYEFQIVNHFAGPLVGGVSDLTYSNGYLYVTKVKTVSDNSRIFILDPKDGRFTGFLEHPSDPINQLKYITSCNGNIYVDHYPLLFNYVIYKIYPDTGVWTTFFEPDSPSEGGIACDGSNLILIDGEYICKISLSDQEEVSRDKFITLQTYDGMTWDGEHLCAITSDELNRAIIHKIDSGLIVEEIKLPSALAHCRGLAYDGEAFWTYVTGALSPYAEEIVQIKIISSPVPTTTTSSTTTIPASTTVITSSSTTTTTSSRPCVAELLYGEDSAEAGLLRCVRDSVFNRTPEGREIIRLYYQWSPLLVKAMEADAEFKQWVMETIDSVLPMIEGE